MSGAPALHERCLLSSELVVIREELDRPKRSTPEKPTVELPASPRSQTGRGLFGNVLTVRLGATLRVIDPGRVPTNYRVRVEVGAHQQPEELVIAQVGHLPHHMEAGALDPALASAKLDFRMSLAVDRNRARLAVLPDPLELWVGNDDFRKCRHSIGSRLFTDLAPSQD